MKGKYKNRNKSGIISRTGTKANQNSQDQGDLTMNNELVRTKWNNGFYVWSHRTDKTFDPAWFFGVKGNIFSVDFERTKKVLISEIQKLHHTIEFLTNNADYSKYNIDAYMKKQYNIWDKMTKEQKDVFTNKFIQNVKDKLEYLLYCGYVVELKTNVGMFEYCPPFHGPILQYALKNRTQNFENYKKLFEYQMSVENHGLFVKDEISIKDIVENNFGTAVRSNTNFLIDSAVQNDLIRNVKKTSLTEFEHKRESEHHIYHQRYLIGEYQGKNVLFVETIKEQKQRRINSKKLSADKLWVEPGIEKSNPPKMGYQLSVVLDGDQKYTRLLYRMDINPTANHINKLTKDGLPWIAQNANDDSEILRKINVQPCHIHIPSTRYNVFFPNYTHSSEATETQMVFLNREDMINFNRKYLNVSLDNFLISGKDQKSLQKSGNHRVIKLSEVIDKVEVFTNDWQRFWCFA